MRLDRIYRSEPVTPDRELSTSEDEIVTPVRAPSTFETENWNRPSILVAETYDKNFQLSTFDPLESIPNDDPITTVVHGDSQYYDKIWSLMNGKTNVEVESKALQNVFLSPGFFYKYSREEESPYSVTKHGNPSPQKPVTPDRELSTSEDEIVTPVRAPSTFETENWNRPSILVAETYDKNFQLSTFDPLESIPNDDPITTVVHGDSQYYDKIWSLMNGKTNVEVESKALQNVFLSPGFFYKYSREEESPYSVTTHGNPSPQKPKGIMAYPKDFGSFKRYDKRSSQYSGFETSDLHGILCIDFFDTQDLLEILQYLRNNFHGRYATTFYLYNITRNEVATPKVPDEILDLHMLTNAEDTNDYLIKLVWRQLPTNISYHRT